MDPTVLLLAASVMASPVFISEVTAHREAGHLRIEVKGDGGIDPDAARTRIDEGRLFLYVEGTRVRASNRAWDLDDGTGEIRAHRHKRQTELVVPLSRTGCAGPVELAGTASGLTALVGCADATPANAAAARKQTRSRAAALTATATAAAATPTAPGVAFPTAPAASNTISKPADKTAGKTAGKTTEQATMPAAVAPASPVAAVEVEAAPPPAAKAAAPAPSRSNQPDVKAAARAASDTSTATPAHAPKTPAPAPAPTSTSTTTAPPKSSLGALAMPVLLLAALAAAAYMLARRRAKLGRRYIQIVETTSLGPKRSLVVARVGDETLIFSSSEAGITLLRTDPAAAVAPSVSTPASVPTAVASTGTGPNELDQSISDALADIPEPRVEPVRTPAPATARASAPTPAGDDRDLPPTTARRIAFRALEGGLAGLLGRSADSRPAAAAPPAEDDLAFDDILEDSIEDQELRQKLAAGIAARVR